MIVRHGILLVLTLLLTVSPVGAELRQWTDENGVKHFSNKEDLPEGVSVERSIEEKESRPGEQHRYRRAAPVYRSQPKPGQANQSRTKPDEAAILKEIHIREAKLPEVFDRIYTKRRYVKRHGKQDIESIRRLNGEIEALAKSGADPVRLTELKEERAAAQERLFNENLRTRKGVGDDIREYKQLEDEIAELKKKL